MSTSKNSTGERVELKRIRNEDDLLVSFSKRRAGIYKKASEVNILCGAQVGIIIFSPSNKPFTYGAPSIEAVVNRFSGRSDQVIDLKTTALEAQVLDINSKHNELATRLDLSKKEGVRLTDVKKPIQNDFWWNAPLENMIPERVEKFVKSMKEIKVGATKMNESFMKVGSAIDDAANIANSSKQ